MDIPISKVKYPVADRDAPDVITGEVWCWTSQCVPSPLVDVNNERDLSELAIAWFRKVLQIDPGVAFREVQLSEDGGIVTLVVPCTGVSN